MKKLSYSFILFSSFGTVLSTSPRTKPLPYEGLQARKMQQSNDAPTSPMWKKPKHTVQAPIRGDVPQKAHQIEHRTHEIQPRTRKVGPLDRIKQPPQQEEPPTIPRKQRVNRKKPTELDILTAKLSTAGNLGTKIRLVPASQQETAQQQQSKPILEIHVNRSKRHRPYHISGLILRLPNGKTNECHADYFFDTKTTKALGQKNLGEGPEWKNGNTLANWRENWEAGKMEIQVTYGDQYLELKHSPRETNRQLETIEEKDWNTSKTQKAVTGVTIAAGTAAALLAAYYGGQAGGQAIATGIAGAKTLMPKIKQTIENQVRKLVPDEQKIDQYTKQVKDKLTQKIKDRILPISPTQEESEILSPQPQLLQPEPTIQTADQQIRNAITDRVENTIYSDPFNNHEILRAVGDKYWIEMETSQTKTEEEKRRAKETWAVTNKAHKINEAIAKHIMTQNTNEFCATLDKVLYTGPDFETGLDLDARATSGYEAAIKDPDTGLICKLTMETYKELCQQEMGLTSTRTDKINQKITAAKKEILRFYNTPKGKQGMRGATTFIESITEKAGTIANPTKYQEMDTTALTTDPILTNGIKVTACLIAIRTIEGLFDYRNKKVDEFARISGIEQQIHE